MPPKPGQRQKKRVNSVAKPIAVERPSLDEVAPLFSTYNQPKPNDAYFDETAATHAVDWIEENLRHFKGKWAGQPFYLLPWQSRMVRELFGWKRADGTRLYRTVYLEVPRKAGKSSLASAVALYLAYGDGEHGPQVYFAAFDKDQASVCYLAARHMVEASPSLYEQTAIYNSRKEMILTDNPGGILKALSADSAKQFGLDLHGLIFDELMTQKTRDQWEALTTSFGAREQPLNFSISTAGWDTTSVCYEQREYARQISEGTITDPTFLGVVYGLDRDADWTLEENWLKANPSLGHTVKLDYYREKAERAQKIPTEQNSFRTLYLSQWVGQAERFIPMDAWDRCKAVPEAPNGQVAFGGLDLSSTTDLTAFVVVAENNGYLDVYPWIFAPEADLRERVRRDRVPYDIWAQQGYLTLTPGNVIDYAFVKATILDASAQFDLRDVGYDRFNSSQIVQELEDEGITMAQIGQGYVSMSPPTKELLRRLIDGKVRHGGNPILRWMADNAAPQMDPAGNVKLAKDKSTGRIDGVIALIMALDGAMRRGRTIRRTSVYETRGLVLA